MRSPFNWGRKYRNELRATLGMKITYANHACSGAVTADISRPNFMDSWWVALPMPSPPVSSDEVNDYANAHGLCGPNAYTDEQYVVARYGSTEYTPAGGSKIVFTCVRYLRPQRDFLGPQTDLVLLTIGGNDIHFSDIVRQCFVPVVRDRDTCVNLIRDAEDELDKVRDRVEATVAELFGGGRLGPDARVVLVGYPLLAMANSGYELKGSPVAGMVRTLGQKGEAMLGQVVSDINADVGNPARGKVVFASDIPLHFAGHEPNPDVGDGNPNGGWLHELVDVLGEWRMESFHPNPLGHTEYMRHLFDHVPGGNQGFGTGAARRPAGDLDLVFAVDTTASMAAELATLKARLGSVLASAAARANTARFALVSYREEPRFSGDPVDYASRLEQDFTDDPAKIVAALAGLDARGGGGTRETMFSGVMTGLDLGWREGVKKSVIAISDNAPHDPEPSTRFVAADVVDKAWSVDPAAVSIVDTGHASDNAPAQQVVTRTAGHAFVVPEDQVDAGLADAVQEALDRPHATITDPTVARVGSTVEIDGAGSYSPTGEIVSYQWDFDGDRIPDQSTTTPIVTHTFDHEVSGDLALVVTDDSGRTSIATQHLAITADGDEIPAGTDNCPDDENMAQTDTDGDGVGDVCDPTPGPTIPDDPVHTRPSRLDGVPRPGNTLTADPGEWNYPATYTFQWLLDGADIPGATTASYTVGPGDVGHRVGVRIVARIEDFGTVKTETLEVLVDPQPLTMLTPSAVTGRPRAGRVLHAVPSRWSGPTTAMFQWLRDGVPIRGASAATYRPGARDVRRRVTVQITTSAADHTIISVDRHGYRIQPYPSRVRLRLTTRPASPGTVIADIRVTTPSPLGGAGRVRILAGHRVVATPRIRHGHATARLPGLTPGDHRLRAQYLGNRLTGRSRTRWHHVLVHNPEPTSRPDSV